MKIIFRTILIFGIAIILHTVPGAAQAQTTPPAPIDPAELAAFLDPIIIREMNKGDIPGAVVIIVQDDQIIFSQGYGHADLARQTTVNPDTTLFRVASVSKLFTATAVLQLVDRGLVDLDTDVNHYLPFTLPDTYSDPITLAHLLTHTSGLDDRQIGDAAYSAEAVIPLSTYLSTALPARIHPPGSVLDYSNHGFALAGYVVEAVSGQAYADYMDEHILRPLHMSHSSFQQPLPLTLQADLATGYTYTNDANQAQPLDYSNVAPADVLGASGADMAHFMIAHLQDGRYQNTTLLTPASAHMMHEQQFTHHPQLPGIGYGFFEQFNHGRRLLNQSGGQLGFASLLALYPDANLGLFIAQNNRNGNLRYTVWQELLNKFAPALETDSLPQTHEPQPVDPAQLAGTYRGTENYFPTTFEKVATVFGAVEEPEIIDNGDGTLTIWEEFTLVPIGPLVYQFAGGQTRVAFEQDENGRITYLYVGNEAYQRLAPWESAALHRRLMMASILILGTAVLFIPLAALRRWWQRRRSGTSTPDRQPAHLFAFLVGLLAITFFLTLDLTADRLSDQIDYGVPTFFIAMLTLPILSTLLSIPLPFLVVQCWRQRVGSLIGRLYLTLVTFAAVLYAILLAYWNLLGYHF